MRLPRATMFSVGCSMLAWATAFLVLPSRAGAETSGPAGVNGYFVTANYRALLNRAPDGAGWLYWKAVLDNNLASEDELTRVFLTCPEYKADYWTTDDPPVPPSNGQFLTDLFQDAYGRQPSGFESSYWLSLLSAGDSQSWVVDQIIAAVEFDTDWGAYAASYYTAYTDPVANGMSPTQATVGTEQPFTLSFSNAYGSSDVFSGLIQMNGCVFTWCIQTGCNVPNELEIGSSYGRAGQSGTLVGSACSINLLDSSFATTQAGYNINPALTFSSSFTGQQVWAMSTSKVWALGSMVDIVTTQSESFGTLTVSQPTYTISGHVTALGSPLTGATMTLSGSSAGVVTTDSSGAYSFGVAGGGGYTVTPSEGGLVFAPLSSSWNNLSANQTADFTALPADYPAGSGPASIANSFTAPDPVLTCDDISGTWKWADSYGNVVRWRLTQTATSITGLMDYDDIDKVTGFYCGRVTYDVTGSYNSNAGSFTLSATIDGLPYDDCNNPVALGSQVTDTVTLSGGACGTGTSLYNIPSAGASVFGNLPQSISRPGRGGHGLPVTTDLPRPTAGAARFRPLFASTGSASWTTVSPRFTVQYSAYIPVDHIAGPTPCLMGSTAAGWKTYKGDASRGTYRTTESLLVVPDAQKYGSLFARGGPTRNYQIPSSPASGLLANLSSTPTGDPWNGPYVGADEDGIQYDCSLWNDRGEADNSVMRGVGVTFENPITQVNLYGLGQDPLEPKLGGVNGIKWNLIISLDTTDPANPKAWVSGGTATCYPAHIVKVNGTKVFEQLPAYNNTAYLVGCLDISGLAVTPSTPVVVSPH